MVYWRFLCLSRKKKAFVFQIHPFRYVHLYNDFVSSILGIIIIYLLLFFICLLKNKQINKQTNKSINKWINNGN